MEGEVQPEPSIIKIDSEAFAWEILNRAIANTLDGENLQLVFDEWPILRIHIEKNGPDASLSAKNMEGLIELQRAINKSYALLVYNSPNTACLTEADRKSIEIFFKVTEGSTDIGAVLGRALDKISQVVAEKMEPKHFVIMVLGVAIIWAGESSWRAHLQHQKEVKQITSEQESRQFASEQEMKKMQLIADLAKNTPQLQAVKETSDEMYHSVLKSVSDSEKVSIAGIKDITGQTVRAMVKSEPAKSKDVRLDGNYRILKVDSSKPELFKVKVRDINTGDTFSALVQDSFVTREKHKNILQNAEWNKQPVRLTVNAKRLKGSITSATIIGVEEIKNG